MDPGGDANPPHEVVDAMDRGQSAVHPRDPVRIVLLDRQEEARSGRRDKVFRYVEIVANRPDRIARRRLGYGGGRPPAAPERPLVRIASARPDRGQGGAGAAPA